MNCPFTYAIRGSRFKAAICRSNRTPVPSLRVLPIPFAIGKIRRSCRPSADAHWKIIDGNGTLKRGQRTRGGRRKQPLDEPWRAALPIPAGCLLETLSATHGGAVYSMRATDGHSFSAPVNALFRLAKPNALN